MTLTPAMPATYGAPSAYLKALLDGDRSRAFGVVDRAREVGVPIGSIYLDVFQRALREVGRLWQEHKISVADEHLATEITQAAMARLFERESAWNTSEGRSLIAACVDSERHEVGLRMVCDLLELDGWDTVFLGATVPTDALVTMVLQRSPDVVAISATIALHLPPLGDVVRAVRAATGSNPPLIIVGGRPFVFDPGLAERLGADLTAPDAAEAVLALTRYREG